jgi:hypothetical protein
VGRRASQESALAQQLYVCASSLRRRLFSACAEPFRAARFPEATEFAAYLSMASFDFFSAVYCTCIDGTRGFATIRQGWVRRRRGCARGGVPIARPTCSCLSSLSSSFSSSALDSWKSENSPCSGKRG